MAKHSLFLVMIILFLTRLDAQAQTQVQVWTSNGANTIQQIVESGVSDLISTEAITPWGLTVDPIAGKLYWSNVTEGTIKRADIDGENIETLLSGLDLPRGIAIDENTGTLFWAEGSATDPGISSVDLNEDPLVITVIDTSSAVSPYHITVDTEAQYVYWADNASSVKAINRIRYDGTGAETIISNTIVKQVAGITLDPANNTLYWSDFEDDVIYSANAAGLDQNVQVVATITGGATPWAIDVDSRSEILYWTDYLNSTINQINLSTSDQTIIASGISTPSGFVVYTDEVIAPSSPENFVTTWRSDNEGSSGDDEITIPTHPGSTYNYDVYWEDLNDANNNGTIENNSGNLTITFNAPGTYRVEIAGIFPRILFFDPNAADSVRAIDPLKILTIDQWGAIEWTSMENAFNGAENLRLTATDAPDLSGVEDLSAMFLGANSFRPESGGTLNNWDVSNVRFFNKMFSGIPFFNGDLSNWETISAVNMDSMFYDNNLFNSDLSAWDVSNVTSMSAMFHNNQEFSADLSGWNVSKVTDMAKMFQGNYAFNSDISSWDVSNVTNMSFMFQNALTFDQDLSNWDVSGVQSFEGTFSNAEVFNGDISEWATGSAAAMNSMFLNASAFNYSLGGWDVGNVSSMENMLINSGLSVENYDKTLIGWDNQTVQPNIRLDADGLQYCRGEGEASRQALIDDDGWIIVDSGPADECVPTDVETEEDLPVSFSLKQNYPNPFNPTTLISFDLPVTGQVRITVYDMAGRVVQTIADRTFTAGSHRVSFDAGVLSSGVYLYRLEADGFSSTRKMILLK